MLRPLFLGLALFALEASAQEAQMNLPRITLSAGIHQIDAQVASTREETSTGLMYRQEMPQSEGMLFAFPQAGELCFWMKNTHIPLTAAFIADDGTIVNLANMQPRSRKTHCAAKPVRFVLEMNQGWFHKRGIKSGFKVTGKPFGN
jgi:hypothetical protein